MVGVSGAEAGTVPEVWVAAGGGCDLVRADAIVMPRVDRTGRLTAQLRDDAKLSVTLLEGSAGDHPPAEFHRRLVRTIAELADSNDPHLVSARDEDGTWRWVSEPL
ncbi:hypothetical protein [Actinomadura sp. 21ATH]|uniref:hypothetical protein n=1 Tax=Actinomadura sp. 21ATH TaxID=1735444 RepID=UPI0035C2390B